jgi:hypothetical protein
MAKQIDYPRATLKNCVELARAVDTLSGKASIEMAADALNKKVGGSFIALASSAAKYGLLVSRQGQLETTLLYRNYKLAYSEQEATARLAEAFLTVPLFKDICTRFAGLALPVNHFEKLLLREFGVPDQMGSRVAKYFLEGAKQCNLLGADHILRAQVPIDEENDTEAQDVEELIAPPVQAGDTTSRVSGDDQILSSLPGSTRSTEYSVRITGPGMDSVIAVNDEEDLLIVKAMLKKVEKRLLEQSSSGQQ